MSLIPVNEVATEGDVETQVVLPLLTRPDLLAIDLECIRSKEFLAAFDIGKGAKAKKGYVPYYAVYILAIPIVAIEVKAPSVEVTGAWEEASLYAHALTPSTMSSADSIKATASGWVHMRLLAARSEYVWGVLPTTALNDRPLEARVFDLMQTEAKFGQLYPSQANGAVEHFHRYLQAQFNSLKNHPGYTAVGKTGSPYIIRKVSEAIRIERSQSAQPMQPDLLDI